VEQQGVEAGVQPGCFASGLPVLSPSLLSSSAAHADLPLQRGLSNCLPADKEVDQVVCRVFADYSRINQMSSFRCKGLSESHQCRTSTLIQVRLNTCTAAKGHGCDCRTDCILGDNWNFLLTKPSLNS